MKYKKGDRVVFIGTPGSYVTKWLLDEQIPGTVTEDQDDGRTLVFVRWDGLPDYIALHESESGIRPTRNWSVHDYQLALLGETEAESVGDTSDLLASLFQNL